MQIANNLNSATVLSHIRYGFMHRSEQPTRGVMVTRKKLPDTGAEPYASPYGYDIPSGITQAVLMHALQLRRCYREVFILCDVQQHTISDAAMILAITPRTVRNRLHGARREMQEVVARICAQAFALGRGAELTLQDLFPGCSFLRPPTPSGSTKSLQTSSRRASAARA
jgi:Sigma-70, region 4